jgi:hypothetical protein
MDEYEECNSCGKLSNVKLFNHDHEHSNNRICIEHLRDMIEALDTRLKVAERNASTAVAVLERLDRAGRL